MRTLTSAAASEAAKKNGASILRILEIEWGGDVGTLYFSDQALSSPISAEAKVQSWGSVVCEGKADSVGGYANTSVELVDADYGLKTLFDTIPGPAAKRVFIHEFFEGTSWPSDRVTIFSGMISGDVEFDASTAIWKLSLKGLEKFYDKSLGTPLTRDKFPTIQCTEHEGKIIPIVYGSFVKRVPARLIAMPGHAYLSEPAGEHSTTLTLTKTCEEMGLDPMLPVSLIVGVVDFWEKFTGYFASSSSNVFIITWRGSILASGMSPGAYGYQGGRYFLCSKSDLPTDESLAGYPLWINQGDGWSPAFVIDNWIDVGSSRGVLREPVGWTFHSGDNWKIGSIPGVIPQWPVSTPVQVSAGWTYAVSHVPSNGVSFIEVRTQLSAGNGAKGLTKYYELNPDRYTVVLDNRAFNDKLGRGVDDPGITTVSLDYPPTQQGFEEGVYVTLDGPSGYSAPGDVIKHLLTNEFLGNVPSELVNITSGVTSVALAFAITEEMKLHDTCAQLAFQGCCVLFWGQGGANLVALENSLGSPATALTESSIQEQSLTLGHSDLEAANTCALAKFKPTCSNPEVKFYRKSTDAVEAYGERRKEIDCWAIQSPEQIVNVLEFWLEFYLKQQRVMKFDCFLDKGLALQPGDVISVNFANGAGATLLSNQKARVTRVEHCIGDASGNSMERLQIEAEFSIWNFEIDDATADLELCEGDGGDTLAQPNEDGDPSDDDENAGNHFGNGFGGTTIQILVQNTYSGGGGPLPPGFGGGMIPPGGNPNTNFGTCEEIEFVTEVGRCEYKTEKMRVMICEGLDDPGSGGSG